MKPETGRKWIHLDINGETHAVLVENNETLAEVLRERLGLTGTKVGCDRGECGACTVLVDGESIVSCMTLAIEHEGKSILTIEGLEDPRTGELDPVQQAFVDNFGIQCGFCSPGMVMSAKALLEKNPKPSEQDIREGIQGNLCRCTGYQQIVESIQAASEKMRRG